MKKGKQIFLIALLSAGLFISCSNELDSVVTPTNVTSNSLSTTLDATLNATPQASNYNSLETFDTSDWWQSYNYQLNPNGPGWWDRTQFEGKVPPELPDILQKAYYWDQHYTRFEISTKNDTLHSARFEKKYPYYIIRPSDTKPGLNHSIIATGRFKVPKYISGSTTILNSGAWIMQFLVANHKPLICVEAYPKTDRIAITMRPAFYKTSYGLDENLNAKKKMYLPHHNWDNEFTITLKILFTDSNQGYVEVYIDGVKTVAVSPSTTVNPYYGKTFYMNQGQMYNGVSFSAGAYGAITAAQTAGTVYMYNISLTNHSNQVRVKTSHSPEVAY